MSILIKIIEWFVFGALLLVLFAAASPLLPTKNALSSYVVSSGSMEPTLPTGSLVFTSYTDPKTLEKGDVITFTQPTDTTSTVVHRIVEKNGEGALSFKTKGDNNNAVDNWTVLPTQVLGETRFSVPYVGYAVSWLKTPLGFALGMGIPALFLLIFQIKKVKEGIQDEVEKRTKEALQKHSESNRIHLSVISFFLLCGLITISSQQAYALFTAQATVTGITLSVGEVEPTPTVTPTITPTASPTPTQGTCNNFDVTISGNGANSTNTVNIDCESSTIINQSNTSTITNSIQTDVNTGGNNVSSDSASVSTGSSSASINISTSTNVNISDLSQ